MRLIEHWIAICKNRHYGNTHMMQGSTCERCGAPIVFVKVIRGTKFIPHGGLDIQFTRKGLVMSKCLKKLVAEKENEAINFHKKTIEKIRAINKAFKDTKKKSIQFAANITTKRSW